MFGKEEEKGEKTPCGRTRTKVYFKYIFLATEDGRHHKYFLVYIMRCREHKRQIKPTKADMKAAGRRLPDIVGNWENKVSVFSKEKNVLG